MTTLTIIDYIDSLKKHIENVKYLSKYTVLLSPSPAQLRDFCLALCDKADLSNDDKTILNDFFKVGSTDVKAIAVVISKFDIDKFKPIQHFLKGKTTTSKNHAVIEMVALLYDYEKRPYGKFLKLSAGESEENKCLNRDVKGSKLTRTEEESFFSSNNNKDHNATIPKNINDKKKWGKGHYAIIIGVIILSGLFVFNSTFLDKQKLCMKWEVDKYVECDCGDVTRLSFVDDGITPVQYSESVLNGFKKIEVDCNTIFFKDNKPKVWFVKIGSMQHEYFSSPGNGVHPVSGKALKPITNYHINKYIYSKCP